MGFFDDIFGGFFDFNGDGKTTWDEEWIAFKIMQDVEKQQKKENPYYNATLLDDDELDAILDEPLFEGDEVDDPYLREIAALDEYGWREIVADNDYGIDPNDYETEEEYLEAIEEAEAELETDELNDDVSFTIPIKLNFSVEMPTFDNIERKDYPNERTYNAALRKSGLEDRHKNNTLSESDKHLYEQCDFILSKHKTLIAANYLSSYFGEFLYAQAVKENFDLPIEIPDEDEQRVTPLDDLFRQIIKVDKQLIFPIWKWCIENFVPYMHYSSDNGYDLSTGVIANAVFVDDNFLNDIADFFCKNKAFGKIVMELSPSLDEEYGRLFALLLENNEIEFAKDLFKICAVKDIDTAHIKGVIYHLMEACSNYQELETMELFEAHIFPIIKGIKKADVQSGIKAWEEEIADYYKYCEENCEKYQFARKNAWRVGRKNEAEELGLDVLNYNTEAEYLVDYNEEKYGWREEYSLSDTYGLNPSDYETEDELINAIEKYCEEQEKKAENKLTPLSTNQEKLAVHHNAEDLRKMQSDKNIYTFVGVMFPYATHHYHYLTDDDSIEIGDNVIVPVGDEQKETVAKVVSVEKHLRISAPFPVEKTKKVIRKYIDASAPLKKMRLISNSECYGPCPDANDEVEQHLTISSDGRVWFSRYNYGHGGNYELREKKQINIGSPAVIDILSFTQKYFKNNNIIVEATDVGSWELTMTDENDAETIEKGSLICDPFNDDNVLCNYIRERLPIKDLLLFDGDNSEWIEL